jgi:Flp pilus assembly protein TadG
MLTFWKNLCRAIGSFRTARAGNVAITFAFATIPIIGAVGYAVDFSHANAVKAAIQAALDSTALMLSKDATTLAADADKNALKNKAQVYFNALFNHPEVGPVTIDAMYSSDGGSTLEVDGTANVPTTFMAALGYSSMAVKGSSFAKWGSSRLRVALVLDNTGSMKDNDKIGALKTATHSLLTQLQNAASVDGDVYVSIIPFVKDVKIDPTNYTSSWDDWIMWDDGTDSSWDGTYGSCSISSYSPRSQCVTHGSCSISGNSSQSTCTGAGTCSISTYTSQSTCTGGGTCSISGHSSQSGCTGAHVCSNPGETTQSNCTNNNACTKSQYTSSFNCTHNGGIWGKGTWTAGVWTAAVWTAGVWTLGVWTHNNHSTWHGCVTERGSKTGPVSDYDRLATEPSSSIPASQFPAEEYSACPQAMMGLSYNWTTMNSLVDSMIANGSTNQPIGLVWGWQSLVGGGPFTVPPKDSTYTYQDIIILLSDGLNTQDRWYGNGSSTSTSVDYRMYDSTGNGTCANIKATGVTIYTIHVNIASADPKSVLLQNCATDSDKFWMLTSADQMLTTFTTIGTNLTKLRVAK